jgi:hypothetical protein
MTDLTPHGGRRTDIFAACAAALRITPAAFAAQVDLERAVGYGDDDAIGAAYLHIADPRFGCGVPGGSDPADPLVAAAYRRSPHREHDADGHRSAALAGLGEDERWEDQVLAHYRYRLPVLHDPQVADRARRLALDPKKALHELCAERLREMALDSASWALCPDDTRRGRRQRKRYRDQVIARCGGSAPPKGNRHRRASVDEAQIEFAGDSWGIEE